MRVLLMASLVATTGLAARPEETLQFHDWYPGFLPGAYGRTTFTLTLAADAGVTLELETQRPPQEQRQCFNPGDWAVDPTAARRLEGALRRATKGGFTATFPLAQDEVLTLDCTPATRPVHAAGATVTPPTRCSPCYERCTELPRWRPASTTLHRGYACRLGGNLPRLPERPFFSASPGVEFITGNTDCPPTGMRAFGPPRLDWTVFPEGTTALREVTVNLLAKKDPRVHTVLIKRHGHAVEVTEDDVHFATTTRDQPATTEDLQHTLGLSCWTEPVTVHSKDVRFQPQPGPAGDVCEGQDEVAKSRAPRKVSALLCRPTRDGHTEDEPLVFMPGAIIERVDVDADCTHRRGLRVLPSLEAPTFGAE